MSPFGSLGGGAGGVGLIGMFGPGAQQASPQVIDFHLQAMRQASQATSNDLMQLYAMRQRPAPEPVKTLDVPFEVIRIERPDVPSLCHLNGRWL